METKIYSIRDSKAEVFNTPFFQKTHGEAERSFRELTSDPKSMVSKYPEDYDLYFVGTYNDLNGVITALETPQHITKAITLNTLLKPNTAEIGHIGKQATQASNPRQ